MPHYTLTYYPWITQHKSQDEIRANIQVFADALSSELDKEIDLAPAMEVPSEIESLVAGRSQIALMNPLGFVFARNKNNSIDASVVALRMIDGKIGDTYFAQIYAHVDSGIKTINDVRSRSIAYGSPQSTSNFIIPAFDLKENGIHPFVAFSNIGFSGGHEKAAIAVYNREYDLGAGHDGAIIDLANQPNFEDAKIKLTQIYRSNPIPSDPIAVNISSESEKSKVQKAMIKIAKMQSVQNAISEFWGSAKGLKETSNGPYEYLLKAVSGLNLSAGDVLH